VSRLHAPGDIRLADEPIPRPRAGESLVRVTAVGLCGSDLHWYGEGQIGEVGMSRPLVLGHEFAGIVDGGPLDGVRVAADPAIACQQCSICRGGDHNLCPNVIFAGHGEQDGALREYVAWPTHLLHALPDHVDDAGGAVLEPLGVALHAMNLAHLRPGATVVVVGTGPLGLLLVQLARAAGAGRIVAVEPIDVRRAAALACGAAEALDPEQSRDGRLRELAGEWGADLVFEVAGNNDAVGIAVDAVRPGGRVMLVGIPGDDRLELSAATARRKGVTLVFVRRMQDLYDRAIQLVTRGAIDLGAVVSHHFELADVDDALKFAATRQALKVIVHP
jgi:L-iditol 2-dehydrogenase